DLADLVLEKLAQRLDEAELHALGQAADVVVALDDRARSLRGHALDDVRVDRALHEPLGALDLRSRLLEDLDEDAPDGLPLLLRVGDALERLQEAFARIDVHELHLEGVAEDADDLLGLALAQKAIVHEDAGEPVADGAVADEGCDRGIDA